MRVVKGIVVFGFFFISMSACFDPPELPNSPKIEFNRLEFIDGPGTDSLLLFLDFQDGNGDLGINPGDDAYISDPYQPVFFLQENPAKPGKLDSLATYSARSDVDRFDVLIIDNPQAGKLVFPRTRKKPGYEFLPPFQCQNYEVVRPSLERNILISREDVAALDATAIANIVDTLTSRATGEQFYLLEDTLAYAPNPDHYNIEVDFFIKEGNDFEEFDWRAFSCQTFDARFPVLSTNDNPLEGTLKYGMFSLGFNALFSIKQFKLRIQIKDRGLNKSNVIETPIYTLDQIRKRI